MVNPAPHTKFLTLPAEDWENLAATLQAFVSLASIQIAIRRLARELSFEHLKQICA
jgi:hypothetical protein